MEKFEFNGDWEIKLNIQKFIQSNSNWGENQKDQTIQEFISLKIVDKKTLNPDPIEEQLNSIEYLIDNQDEVLKSLCKAFDKINKKYGEYCGEHDWYPENITINELGSIFYVSEISIFLEHKEGKSYMQFSGEYKGDYEHGLIVVLHNNKLIGFNQMGEDVYSEIFSDLGEERDKFRNFNIKHQDFGKNQVHQPIPKYGKHKPWQLDATEEHLENLIRAKKDKEFIREFAKSNLDINFRFPFVDRSLVEIAVSHNNINVINYLMENGALASNSLIKCTYRDSFNRDTINCLINNGISIDTITYQDMTPLGLEVKNLIWYIGSLANYKDGDSRIDSAYKEIEKSKERIQFYVELGANPKQIDIDGNDYKSILLKHYNQEQLKKHKAYLELKKIISQSKPRSKWKFWKN